MVPRNTAIDERKVTHIRQHPDFEVDEERILEELRKFERDSRWISSNIPTLRARYPDKYVAVWDGKVVDSDKNHNRLLNRLRKREYDVPNMAIEYIPSRPVFRVF